MKNRFFVKEKSLLLIAGIVWLMAGFNVARLGVLSYLQIERQWYLYLLSMLVFFLFGRMFFKMSKKHTKRIIAYEEYRPFCADLHHDEHICSRLAGERPESSGCAGKSPLQRGMKTKKSRSSSQIVAKWLSGTGSRFKTKRKKP